MFVIFIFIYLVCQKVTPQIINVFSYQCKSKSFFYMSKHLFSIPYRMTENCCRSVKFLKLRDERIKDWGLLYICFNRNLYLFTGFWKFGKFMFVIFIFIYLVCHEVTLQMINVFAFKSFSYQCKSKSFFYMNKYSSQFIYSLYLITPFRTLYFYLIKNKDIHVTICLYLYNFLFYGFYFYLKFDRENYNSLDN